MSVGRVECAVQVHQECVAVPAEVVLDVRVGELSAVDEVCGCDMDQVAGPCEDLESERKSDHVMALMLTQHCV